jgi:hypothetical protein
MQADATVAPTCIDITGIYILHVYLSLCHNLGHFLNHSQKKYELAFLNMNDVLDLKGGLHLKYDINGYL